MSPGRTTPSRDEAIRAAGVVYVAALAEQGEQTPWEVAEAAHVPDGPGVARIEWVADHADAFRPGGPAPRRRRTSTARRAVVRDARS